MKTKIESLRLTGKNFIPTCEIIYLQSDWNYTVIHTINSRKHISGFTLKIWEERIHNNAFLRINKGLLINRQYIKEVSLLDKEKFLCLTNGSILPISRRKYKEFKTYFDKVSA